MLNLLIDDAIVSAHNLFSPLGEATLCSGKKMVEQAQTADVLVIRSRTKIDENLLAKSPKLKFIGSSVVGLDHVDQEACAKHGVTFYSAQGCNARSVAEYVISHLVSYVMEQQKTFEQITLGIVGVGQVGKRIEKMAKSLGVRCLLNDPPRAESEINFVHTELNDLLAQSDVITFHTPLTRSGKHPSYHLLTQQNISLIAPNSLLINAARGGVIDESALLTREDLNLVIDCWENEPFCNPELLKRSIRATPHIAGHALDAKYRGGQMVVQALADWLTVNYQAPNLAVSENKLPIIKITDQETTQNPITELARCLTQIYDFSQDDYILRTAMQSQSTDSFAQTFEDYRRHYPDRYEWHNIKIPNQLNKQTKEWLMGLMIP